MVRKYTEMDSDNIAMLYSSGVDILDIAKQIKRHPMAVRNLLIKLGHINDKRKMIYPDMKARIIELRKEGKSCNEISEITGVSPSAISTITCKILVPESVKNEIVKLLKNGDNINNVALKLNVSRNEVRKISIQENAQITPANNRKLLLEECIKQMTINPDVNRLDLIKNIVTDNNFKLSDAAIVQVRHKLDDIHEIAINLAKSMISKGIVK